MFQFETRSLYCFESRRRGVKFVSDNLIFIIHPELYGSSFTISGLDSNSELNSIISPLNGINKSETVFTASTVPKTDSDS